MTRLHSMFWQAHHLQKLLVHVFKLNTKYVKQLSNVEISSFIAHNVKILIEKDLDRTRKEDYIWVWIDDSLDVAPIWKWNNIVNIY